MATRPVSRSTTRTAKVRPKKESKLKARLAEIRERRPLLDRILRTVDHFSDVQGSIQAGGITYFGFISFFPVLALSFAVIGVLAQAYGGIEDSLVAAINAVFPGLVGNGDGQVSLASIREAAPGIASVGLLVVLYSGLGWLSSTRTALLVMFDLPEREQPNFIIGKIRDLFALVSLGVILLVSVSISGVARGASQQILDWLGLGSELSWLLGLIAIVLGLAANVLLFYALFRILAQPELPGRALRSGALVGGIGFEVLKQVSQFLLASTANSPAFQAFGIALILVVWINYFAKVLLYAAAWAYEHPAARAVRPDAVAEVQGPQSPPLGWRAQLEADAESRGPTGPFAAGALAMLAVVAVVRRRG